MAFLDIFAAIFSFIWDMFKTWLSVIFVAPLKNLEMLWIIIPIWFNWFFAEFFQEKKGTSLGNAISNGGVLIWVGIDWVRYTLRLISEGSLKFGAVSVAKIALAALVLGMGIFIVIEGIKTKKFVHFVGRVRQTTYVLVMVSPIIYGVIPLSWKVFVAAVVFAPLFYYLIELIDRLLPEPKTYKEEESALKPEFKPPEFRAESFTRPEIPRTLPPTGYPSTSFRYPPAEKPKI